MKVLIATLVLASFLQATVLPFDLVLLILVLRAYIVNDKNNLVLAFLFGLLISHLNTTTLGLQSIIYLILVQGARIVSRLPISNNIFTVIPLVFISASLNALVTSFLTQSSLQLWPKVFIESMLALPVFIFIRFWEERFVARSDIKLKF